MDERSGEAPTIDLEALGAATNTDPLPTLDIDDLPDQADRLRERSAPGEHELFEAVDGVFVASVTLGPRTATPLQAPASGLEAGARFGSFYIEERLGDFDEGDIWRARRTTGAGTRRRCVVRALSNDFAPVGSVRRRRFLAESSMATQFDCANLVRVQGVGDIDGIAYAARDQFTGVSLDALIRSAPDTLKGLAALLYVGQQLSRTLAFLESLNESGARFVHGHLGLEAVHIAPDGRPMVSDPTLSVLEGERLVAREASSRGRLGYAAPEQLAGEPIDSRADIFSLGVILLELLGGAPLHWDGGLYIEDLPDQAEAACHAASGLPTKFPRLLKQMLAPSVERRPPTAHAVARTFEHLLDSRFDAETQRAVLAKAVERHEAIGKSARGGTNAFRSRVFDHTAEAPIPADVTIRSPTLGGGEALDLLPSIESPSEAGTADVEQFLESVDVHLIRDESRAAKKKAPKP